MNWLKWLLTRMRGERDKMSEILGSFWVRR